MTKRYYVGLDALRGVAAVAVVLFHRRWWQPGGHCLDHAFLAVDFFFGLSGFVIAQAYQQRLVDGMSLGQFARVRAIRLMPMAVLAGLIAAAFFGYKVLRHGAVVSPGTWLAVAANALALPAPFPVAIEPDAAFPVNGPAWSLFFELIVNLVFALIAVRLDRRLLTAILLASLAALLAVVVGTDSGVMHLGNTRADLLGGVPRTAFSFFLGVWLYRNRSDRPLPVPGGLAIPVLVLLGSFWPDAGLEHEVAYQLVCIGLIYPVIIAVVARIETPPRLMPLALWLGALSYPIYVLHYPIYQWLERFMPASLGGRLWIAAALIVVLSHLALKWIDIPVRRGLARWSAGG